MDNNAILDEFTRNYYGQLAGGVYGTPVPIQPEETALVIIDAQRCIEEDYFVDAYKAMPLLRKAALRFSKQSA